MRKIPRIVLNLSVLTLLVSTAFLAVRLRGEPQSTSPQPQKQPHAMATPRSSGAQPAPASSETQSNPLVAPLFLQDNKFTSFVTMVNEAKADLTATLVVHAPEGTEVARQPYLLAGHSSKVVELSELLGGRLGDVEFGSVTLIPQPSHSMMPIGAQLSIEGSDGPHPLYLDSEFLMPAMKMMTPGKTVMMNLLRGVAIGAVGPPTVALTNTSPATESATLTCVDESHVQTSPEVFVIPAFGTKLVKACEKGDESGAASPNDASKRGRSIGISLEYTGSPGDIVAFGYNAFGSASNLSAIEFHDVSTLSGKGSVWTGIPIGATQNLTAGPFQPKMALANFSNVNLTAQLSLWKTAENAQPEEQTFTLQLPPLSARTLDMSGVTGSPEMQNSFVLTSSGEPGDVVASLLSYNESSGQLAQTLVKDLGQTENAGGHPWTLEGGIDSILLLFNPTSASLVFNVKIPASGTMWAKAYTLDAGATLKLDLAQLVAAQAKDDHGFRLPKDLKGGELSWFNANPALGFGRVVQTAPGRRLARNFSCGYYIVLCGSYLDTSSVIVPLDFTGLLGAVEPDLCDAWAYNACSGNYYSQGGSGYTYSWSAGNPSIASISGSSTNPSANFLGNSLGTFSGYGTIATSYCSFGSSGSGSVTPTVKIQTQSNSNNFVFVGTSDKSVTDYNTQLAVGNPYGATGTYTWSVAPESVTITPNGTTGAYLPKFTGNTPSSGVGKTTEKVTYSYNGTATDSRAITLREFSSLTTPTTKTGCPDDPSAPPPGKGYLKELIYNIITSPGSQQVESGFGGMAVAESVKVTSVTPSTFKFNPVPQDAGTSDSSQIYDCQGIASSTALPSNLVVCATQTISVGGIQVRANTLKYTNTDVNIVSTCP